MRDGWRCLWCTKDLEDAENGARTLDHLVAREHGGTNDSSNLVTSCLGCNAARKDLPVLAFACRLARNSLADEVPFLSPSEIVCAVLERIASAVSTELPELDMTG